MYKLKDLKLIERECHWLDWVVTANVFGCFQLAFSKQIVHGWTPSTFQLDRTTGAFWFDIPSSIGMLLQHQWWSCSDNTCARTRCSLQPPELLLLTFLFYRWASGLWEVKHLALEHTGNYSQTDPDTGLSDSKLAGFCRCASCFRLGVEFLQWWVHHHDTSSMRHSRLGMESPTRKPLYLAAIFLLYAGMENWKWCNRIRE